MESISQITFLETLFLELAQVLASPGDPGLPGWMSSPGVEWPFFQETALLLSSNASDHWSQANVAMQEVPATSISNLQQEYEQLFVGLTRPPIWLYESYYVDGRILGPTAFSVSALYSTNGLDVEGSELPDHASVELAYLAYLTHQANNPKEEVQAQSWVATRKLFIKDHAGRWLPGVGKALAESGYPVWVAIGYLLIASLEEENIHKKKQGDTLHPAPGLLPSIQRMDECILCGFCVQSCPAHALSVREDRQTTTLWLSVPACTHCKKCVKVCPPRIIEMIPTNQAPTDPAEQNSQPLPDQFVLLTQSPRVACPRCGEPTVSRAELDYVIQCIGHPNWVDYCSKCRVSA